MAKLVSVFSYLVAMRRNWLSSQKKFSTRWRPFVHREVARDRAHPIGLGGMTAMAPRPSSSARIQSMSKALSASRASKSIPSINGATPMLSWRAPAGGRATLLVRNLNCLSRSKQSENPMITPDFDSYLRALRETPLNEHTEHTGRTALEMLLKAIAADQSGAGTIVQQEPKRVADKGAPDFKVSRQGMILGYVETKSVGEKLTRY